MGISMVEGDPGVSGADFGDLCSQLKILEEEKPLGWQEAAVKLIRQSRLDDPVLEMNRLRTLGVVSPDIEKKMDNALNAFYSRLDLTKVMLARALEIQKIYRETHHVFVHAQSSKWLVFPHLVKELMRQHCPNEDLHQFKFLRLPNLSRNWDISKYSEAETVYDHDPIPNEDLISCDGYFYNTQGWESALYFMNRNKNIMSACLPVIQKVIDFFYPRMNAREAEGFAQRAFDLTDKDSSKVGNLFLVCIPKDKSSTIQYRAHAYGSPCGCHKGSDPTQILEGLQDGQLNSGTSCGSASPQFRLFTPELTKENGVKIYLVPSDKSYAKDLKQRVRHLIQEIDAKAFIAWKKKIATSSLLFFGPAILYAFVLFFGFRFKGNEIALKSAS